MCVCVCVCGNVSVIDCNATRNGGKVLKVWTMVRRFDQILYAPITPHWKVLRSRNLHHSAPLEMPFPMVSLFAEIGSISFWPKTMDYSKAV